MNGPFFIAISNYQRVPSSIWKDMEWKTDLPLVKKNHMDS